MTQTATLLLGRRPLTSRVLSFFLYDRARPTTCRMKVLSLVKNPFSIQKCLLPDCEFVRENSGAYCVVSQNETKIIVKLGLCEVKNVADTVFLDDSVSLFGSLERALRTERLSDITLNDITVQGKARVAKTVRVTVVFADVFDVKKHSRSAYTAEVVKEILKLFAFSSSSSVLLNDLSKSQKFGINRLLILDVDGSKGNRIFSVGSETVVKVDKCISQLNFEQCQESKNQIRVGGCRKVYEILKECVDLAKCFDRKRVKLVNKLLLIGLPGCGKTTLVQNVASDCKSILLEISPSVINILPQGEMESQLRNYFEEAKIYAESGQCCVILIENIHMMSSGKSVHAKKFLGELISLLEEVDDVPGVVVVATTSCPSDVDLQLRRAKRLEDELEIMVPTAEERVEILKAILSHCKVDVNEELLCEVSHWTPGFVGADLRQIVVEALMIVQKQGSAMDQNLLRASFKQALTKVIPSALRGAVGLCKTNNMTFSQIGGLEEVKRSLDMLIKQQLLNPAKFQKLGIPLTRGVLLYGPPGCAKTTLVKALAKECNTTFLATSAADLYSPYVGDAEKKIVQLFTQARIGSPSIVFIDEIDAVVGSKSGDRERGVQERILSTLLIEMDGVGLQVHTQRDGSLNVLAGGKAESPKEANAGVVVIGATNRPQHLDDALKRPGRFDRLLYIPPPDEPERLRILEKLTEKMPLHESVDLKEIAKVTEFYSGADLKNLCQESGLHALKESNMTAECIHRRHFEHVLSDYKPSLNESVVNFYESFQKYNI